MLITFELPQDIASAVRQHDGDLACLAREALLLELFRRNVLSHRQVADCLGLDRAGLEVLLKGREIWTSSPSMADLQLDSDTIEAVLNSAR